MDRKSLLLEAPSEPALDVEEEAKLRKATEDGGKYLTLVNSAGWKDLVENFINPRLSQDRYLTADKEDLSDVRAAQKELFLLLQYVAKKVDDGTKAYQKLTKL